MHAVAVASLLLSGLAWPVKLAGAAAVLAHAALRRPRRLGPLHRRPDGLWSLPAVGLVGLALRPGTAVGPFWILLRLGAGGADVSVLLLKDQLDDEPWRRLQAELRRGLPAGTV